MFFNVNDANESTMNPETFTTDNGSLKDSARDAYREVVKTMPAAYRAISVEEEDWPATGIFTIGDGDTTSDNPPLRTGFAYRAFIRTYSEGSVKVHYFTNILLLLSLIYYRGRGSLVNFQLALIFQLFLKIQVSY